MDQFLGVLLDLGNNPSAMAAINILAPVLLGALLFWMIGKGIAGGAARSRKRHDVAMHAADTLSRLYGDLAGAGKAQPQTAAAACETLTLQLCSGRTLGKPDMTALQGIRQQVLGPREGGAALDMAKFNEHALHLSRVLSGAGPNLLPPLKVAQKQLHDATGLKPAAPAKKSEPAPAKKTEPMPVAATPAPVPAATVVAPVPPSPAQVVAAVEKA